jgi:uncharacterized protein with PIN domain
VEYILEFNPYAQDAQKIAKDLNFHTNYLCLECNEKLMLKLKLINPEKKIFEAIFVCPGCGEVVK